MLMLWDRPDSMRASAQEADQLRERIADTSDQTIANTALYEVLTVGVQPGGSGRSCGR